MHPMTRKYGNKTGDFTAQLSEFIESAKGAIEATQREIIIDIGRSVIKMSPVGNPDSWEKGKAPKGYVGGTFRNNWNFSISTPDLSTTDETDISGSKAIARLVEGAIEFQAGQTAYITNNLPYAIPLEYGYSDQAPDGMVRITIAKFTEIVEEAIRNNQL